MIESRVQITAVENGIVWVVADDTAGGCNSCSSSGSCGAGLLAKLKLRREAIPVKAAIQTAEAPRVGDFGILGIDESVYLKGMLQVYLLPLLMLIGFAVCADLFFENELFTIFSGLTGLAIGLLYIRFANGGEGRNLHKLPQLIKTIPRSTLPESIVKLAV